MARDGQITARGLASQLGTTSFTYNLTGLATEDGPFADDLLTYTYNQRLRTRLTLAQIQAAPWVQDYSYDLAKRLSTLTSPAGTYRAITGAPAIVPQAHW